MKSQAPPRQREGRKLAFLALYEVDVARHPPGAVLERLAAERKASDEALQLARRLVAGTLRHRSSIDELIQQKAPAWPLSNMSPVDRNILRLGVYELRFRQPSVPVKVAINESVELAKGYGSDSSQRFVNGVLGGVLESLAVPQQQGDRHAKSEEVPNRMGVDAEARLRKIIAEQLSVGEDEVIPEASFIDDLNADSLDLVELIMSLEEEFGVKISDEEAEKIRTVQDAMDYLREHAE